jgi:CheY-like chemotaxis protein
MATAFRAVPTGGETVLIVEDEAGVRSLGRRILETRGYRVLEAGSGQEALRVADEQPGPIHLLIADLVMPDLGGRQLADRLVVGRPGLRVLYVSGYTDDALIRAGEQEEPLHFLQKPFSLAALAQKVRGVLDAPAPGDVGAAHDFVDPASRAGL